MSGRTKAEAFQTNKDAGVAEIIEAMLTGFDPARLYPELAKKYGVAVQTVAAWASDAARFLRMCRGNEETFREAMLSELHQVAESCKNNVRTWVKKDGDEVNVPSPDHRNWLGSIDLRARVYGITSANGQAGGSGRSGGQIEVTIDELRAVLEPLGWELRRKDGGSSEDSEG